jgi:uracil-DNA glycosylase family 4
VPSAGIRVRELGTLYNEIYRCTACMGVPGCRIREDPERVLRRVVPGAVRSEVFLVGQALGGRTQRRSGLPYCFPDHTLSPAGRRLNVFLRSVGYSIDPHTSLRYAYSSDVIQRYPGRRGNGDRQPSKGERDMCALWLKRELALVRPKVVVLLGSVAARDFLERYGTTPMELSVVGWGKPHECNVGGRRLVAVPVPHFSSRLQRDRRQRILRRARKTVSELLAKDDVRAAG